MVTPNKDTRLTPMQWEMLIKQHEKAWAKFESLSSSVSFDDVVWPAVPGNDAGTKEGDLLRHMLRKDRGGGKIRELRMRWHPDKFIQKFGSRIRDVDKTSIMKRVNEIAGLINQLAT